MIDGDAQTVTHGVKCTDCPDGHRGGWGLCECECHFDEPDFVDSPLESWEDAS